MSEFFPKHCVCVSRLRGLPSMGTLRCGERTGLGWKLFPSSEVLRSDSAWGSSALVSWDDSSETLGSGSDSNTVLQSGGKKKYIEREPI